MPPSGLVGCLQYLRFFVRSFITKQYYTVIKKEKKKKEKNMPHSFMSSVGSLSIPPLLPFIFHELLFQFLKVRMDLLRLPQIQDLLLLFRDSSRSIWPECRLVFHILQF